jgi:hypothetical protein
MSILLRPDIPTGFDPAHVEIPELNAANRKENVTEELQKILTTLSREVLGPFNRALE